MRVDNQLARFVCIEKNDSIWNETKWMSWVGLKRSNS